MTYDELQNLDRKLTDKEFASLERNSDGDIIELSTAFILLTDSQIEKLTSDDQSRLDDYQEELRVLMAEAMAEFA